MQKSIFLYSAFFLICLLSLLLIVSNLSFLLGFDLNLVNVVISVVVGVLILIYIVKIRRDAIVSLVLAFTVSVISYELAVYIYDISYDGQGYHQETIYLLKSGWNPLYEQANPFRWWVNYYQKGNEIIQANIYLLTNRIESGKMFNLLLVYIAFVFVYRLVSDIKLHWFYQWIISFVVVFNPVVFTQVFTYYIDSNWYLTLVILLSSLMSYFITRSLLHIIVFVAAAVVFCSLKLTSIPVIIFFLVFAFAYNYLFIKQKLIGSYISLFVLAGICNVHPFITNIANGYHVLHPFAGEQKTDILNQNIPTVLLNHNRVERLLISLFSKPNNERGITLHDTLNFPFLVDKSQLFLIYDTRLGGFGFLFSGLIIIAFLLLMYLLVIKNKEINKKKILIVLLAVLVSILINPAAWWARLSPQIWIFPIIIIVFGLLSKNRLSQTLSQLSLVIIVINIMLPLYLTINDIKANQKRMENIVNSVGAKTIILDTNNAFGFQQYYLKFKEKNIKYKIGDTQSKNQIAPFTRDVYYEIK